MFKKLHILNFLVVFAWLTSSALEVKFQSKSSIQSAGGRLLGGKFIDSAVAGGVLGGDRAMLFGDPQGGIELTKYKLPLKEGWCQFAAKLSKSAVAGREYFFVDSLGTPNWYNRFFITLRTDEIGNGFLNFVVVDTQNEHRISAPVSIAVEEWHQVAVRWKNINSGKADGEMELFWDGKSVSSVKGQRIDLPQPSKKIYIGNMDLSGENRIGCGSDTFAMDQFEIASGAFPVKKMDSLVNALPKIKVRDMADGEPLLANEVKGGGDCQYAEVPFPEFPYKNGTFWCRATLSEIIPGRSVLLFDSCGSPNWNDRIGIAVRMQADNQVKLEIYTCGEPCGAYVHRQIDKLVSWAPGSTHTVAFQWKNVSSGKADMELTCYFDGVNVVSLNHSESNITHPAPFVRIGGSKPPASTEAKKDVLTIHECRFWRAPVSASEIALLATDKKNAESQQPQIQVPRVASLTIAPEPSMDFWNKSATFGWLHHYRQEKRAVENTVIKCGFDENNLYFAWRAKLDGGMPAGGGKAQRDAALWDEDSVEFMLGRGENAIHLILNAYGDIYDEKNGKSAWNSKACHKVGFNAREWYGTLAIPLSELEISAARTLPVTVCRNITPGQLESSSWLTQNFMETGIMVLADNDTIVNEWNVPVKPVVGSNRGVLKLFRNNETNSTINLDLTIRSQDGKPAISRLQRDLSAGTLEVPFDFAVKDEGMNEYSLSITDKSGKVIFANHGILFADPQLKITGKGDFSHNRLNVTIDASQVAGIRPEGMAVIVQENTQYQSRSFQLKNKTADFSLDTAGLHTAGQYILRVTMTGKDGKKIVRDTPFLFAPRPEYISKNAGNKTYFGKDWFSPQFQNGKVKVWGREYIWSNTIFPASIVSAKDELLAEPMFFEYRLNGKRHRLSKAKIIPQDGTPEMAVFTVAAEDTALTVRAHVFVEYDGHIGYDLDIAPKGNAKINYLALVMPLTARNARYKLQDHEETFSEERCDISHYPAGGKSFSFVNMAGIGTMERALYFYTESNEGWLPYHRDNVEKITPQGNKVEWRWTLVDGEPLTKLPTQRWGFMASPYRSPASDELTGFRQLVIWPGGVFYPDDKPYNTALIPYYKENGVNIVHLHMNWSKYTGGHEPDDAQRLKDFVKACHAEGIRVLVYLSNLLNEYEPGLVYYGDNWLLRPTGGWFGYPWEPKTKYSSMCCCTNAPDFVDWWVGGCEKLLKEYDLDGFYYDFGIGGCNNVLHGCGFAGQKSAVISGESTGTLGVNIGEMSTEDKNRGTTLTMRSNRELWRRMYNLVKEYKGEDGCIYAHTCDPARIFTFPFMDVTVHSEHAACHGYGKFTSLDKYRLYFSRQDQGTRGHAISNKIDTREASRRQLAVTLPHRELTHLSSGHSGAINSDYASQELLKLRRVFTAFDADNAEWMPYYQNRQFVAIENATPLTNASVWLKPESALIVLSNLSDADRVFTVKLSGKLQGFTKVTDVDDVNGKAAISANTLTVQVGKDDFRLLKMEK